MNYEEALQFWLARVNYEQRAALPGDLKLDRMRTLLTLLGNPHDRLRIVHVAGSKGKGSTSAFLASILRAAGYRTGLFTSPHLVDVEERFQVNGQSMLRSELTALLGEIHALLQTSRARSLDESLTFFEICTAIGFLHFVRRRVEVAVLEVGLGGRFDSTNVCRSMVSIVTSISFDHMQQLGNTLASIAGEKAGIIKPGQPVVSGVRGEEARAVIDRVARERGAKLRAVDSEFTYKHEPACIGKNGDRFSHVEVHSPRRKWPRLEVGLVGEHQAANAALAVIAVEELRAQGLHLPDAAVAKGLAKVDWPARLEVVARRPLIVLDCAHNDASAHALVQALLTSFPLSAAGRRLLVFAGSRDKDLKGMLEILTPHFDHVYLTRFRTNPRCLTPEQLGAMLPATSQAKSTLAADANEALQLARRAAGPDDLICVTGSVFLAGELRPVLIAEATHGGS